MYEYGGKERVVDLAGGNALAGSHARRQPVAVLADRHEGSGRRRLIRRRDRTQNIQLEEDRRTEDGRKERRKARRKKKEATKEASTGAAAVTAGKSIFASNCSVCHGLAGTGGNGGPDLNNEPRAKSVSGVIEQLTNPLGAMPSFKEQLSAKEKEEVAAYVTTEVTHVSK